MAYGASEKELSFSIFFYEEEGDVVVAHCLELDIVAASDTFVEAQKEIIALICAQIDYAFSHDNVENLYHPAPPEVWQRFLACRHQKTERHKIRAEYHSSPERLIPSWLNAHTCIAPQACHV